ncbi:uncharacterized protein LOC133155361 isoform X7 [Syngnathus typhle]|uniref:uncharacterized protein LOC133155361 isoform X7 n=1 Tax=Syngnathus typhle TaxID=161592 RepID=UPI002A6B8F9D|nr:uncharacterized protein LOC133155361 isoform X7 [Syngnathus typhle]
MKAVEVFKAQIKNGPTFVCTVCHRALFPNQVRACQRRFYEKNRHVVASCLTGQFVHICDDECQASCSVPAERKLEWICHTCYSHLKDGQQRAIRGNVVCVPSEVQETVNVLPRLKNFFQLPPVRQSKPLCVYDPTRPDHWRDDFKKITLTAIMRQKDDVAFAELLNRLRVKEKSDELSEMDRALLATRWMAITLRCWNCLIRTLCRLTRMTTRKTKELAEWQGLCNGMFAKVVKLVNYPNEARVQKLGLELDHVSNTARAANPVYIDRLEEKLNKAGVTRRQFPIKLAFACTIHKVQGMTTSQAAVSLKGVFEHGMGYVALSRVTSLSGLHILHMDERRLHANPQITAALAEMAEDSLESVMPLLRVMPSVDRANHLVVVHHNTEGLSCHVQDIVSHHELLFADVLCFTETHLQGSVADGRACLEGYMMFCRNRSDSYTNCPDLATKRGGGVGICVKSHIVAQEKKYVQGVTDIEFVVVMLGSPVFE